MRNRYLLGAGVALAVALSWANAQAQLFALPPGPGALYFGIEGGWTNLEDQKGRVGAISFKQRWNDGYNVGARLGYELGPLRFEEEFNYRDNHLTGLSSALTGPIPVTGHRSALAIMTNAIYDFTLGWPVSPHLGFGVGAVHEMVEVPVDAVAGLAVEHHRRAQLRAAAPHREERVPEVLVDDGADGVGVGEDVGQRGPPLRRVDRHRVGADEDDPEVGPEELGPVGQQQGHLLARPHPQLEEAVGGPLGVGEDVAPGNLLVLPLQPGGVGVVGHPLADRLLDGALSSSHTDHPFAESWI